MNLFANDDPVDYPKSWNRKFPSCSDIVEYTSNKITSGSVDERLIERRNHEFEIFQKLEDIHSRHILRKGFQTVEEFVSVANSLTNRRKCRSGTSLELHIKKIFDEENVKYSYQATTENGNKPDFITPSIEAYWSTESSKMVAVKTTCKDRWRQILSEAPRCEKIYLVTTQEDISANQIDEMVAYSVSIVMPSHIMNRYKDKRNLMSIGDLLELL